MHKMLKKHQIFPKLYRGLLYVVFHILESQNARFDDVRKGINLERSKGNFVCKNLKKISIVKKT